MQRCCQILKSLKKLMYKGHVVHTCNTTTSLYSLQKLYADYKLRTGAWFEWWEEKVCAASLTPPEQNSTLTCGSSNQNCNDLCCHIVQYASYCLKVPFHWLNSDTKYLSLRYCKLFVSPLVVVRRADSKRFFLSIHLQYR